MTARVSVSMPTVTSSESAVEAFAVGEDVTRHGVMKLLSAGEAQRYARRSDATPAMVTYTHWVLSQIDYDEATAFWRDAAEKAGLASGDPVIALTNRFAEARRNREALPRIAQLSVIYRAWNARRAGKQLRLIKVNSAKGGLIEIPEPR